MQTASALRSAALAAAFSMMLFLEGALASDYPAPKESDWMAHDFKFHTGEVMPELRLHYTTVGEPSGEPVLVLHGTTGSGASMLTPAFAGELFGPGQPLDRQCLRRLGGGDGGGDVGHGLRPTPACTG